VFGARLDKFGNIAGAVVSPRLSCIWKPGSNHAIRISANRAFRAPSLINNYLDQVVLNPVDLKPLFPNLPPQYTSLVEDRFLLPQRVLGNRDLQEESITAYELGYVGSVNGRRPSVSTSTSTTPGRTSTSSSSPTVTIPTQS
jgi:outer membrane receptor for ferrienterochelin and colicin